MKNLVVLAIALFALVGCTSKDVEPIHAGEALSGTYSVTSFFFQSSNDTLHLPMMPYTVQENQVITGKLDVTRLAAMNQVSLKLTLLETGQEHPDFRPTDIENVEVRAKGDEYELHVGNTPIATADGKVITFDVTTRNSQTGAPILLRFRAER